MKMLSIELVGNKRLMLARIKHIKIDFNQNCQIIIGTNGSGKSTIVRELSMMPAISTDYIAGGSKIARAEHKDAVYVATSTYSGHSWKHSLFNETEGVELNPGMTKPVQKQLVSEIFGTTEGLFDIFVGDTLFTNLPPQKRREWILYFSGSDLNYAMGVYKQINSRLRDAKTLVEHYSKRLATELEQQVSKHDATTLEQDSKSLVDYINVLITERHGANYKSSEVWKSIQELYRSIGVSIQSVLDFDITSPEIYDANVSLEDNYQTLEELKHRRTELTANLQNLYQEAKNIQEILDILERKESGDVQQLIDTNATIKSKMMDIMLNCAYHFEDKDPVKLHGAFHGVMFELVDIFTHMADNQDGYYNPDEYKKCTDKLQKKKREVFTLQSSLEKVNHEIFHYKNIESVDCTQCGNHFTPGSNPEYVDGLDIKADQLLTSIQVRESEIKLLEESLELHQLYNKAVDRLNRIIDQRPTLKPLWNRFADMDILNHSPQAMEVIHTFKDDLELSLEYATLSKEFSFNEAVLKNIETLTKGQNDVSKDHLNSVELNIQSTLNEIDINGSNIKDLQGFLSKYQQLSEIHNRILTGHQSLIEMASDFELSLRNEILTDDLHENQILLSTMQHRLHQYQISNTLIKEIRDNKAKAEDDYQLLKVMVEKLSPVHGLIAQRIKGFNDEFISQMNRVISEIWTYKLEIQCSDLEEDGINCKYPLIVEKDEFGEIGRVESPDVSKSSSSQTDIINFAFRMAAMMCMGLSDYPLYLDEVGIRMDEKHRDRFNSFIERFIESNQSSQVFIVSHYIATHGLFTQAEICLLDRGNIVNLPEVYNEHVSINT